MKHGITGWAQVNGFRVETDTIEKMENRVKYDLYYIEHWSVPLDLYILLRTLFVGFVHPHAYCSQIHELARPFPRRRRDHGGRPLSHPASPAPHHPARARPPDRGDARNSIG